MEADSSINRSQVYFTSVCRAMAIDQETGILICTSRSNPMPIGQFISALPLTPVCKSFSIEIINPGKRCIIAIGVCPKNYPPLRLPGWEDGSVGYHADNGGMYVATGTAVKESEACSTGDVMKCEVNFKNGSILFYKNKKLIHMFDNLRSTNNLHAAVGLWSEGETVRLLETRPWEKTRKISPSISLNGNYKNREETVYFACISREVTICQENGVLTYAGDADNVPVSQFISASPLTPDCNSFSFEIVQPGDHCYIAIGVCPKTYPPNHQPGWTTGSFGYHADDGGIFTQFGLTKIHKDKCNLGDVMKCQIDFVHKWILFFKNNKLIHTLKNVLSVDSLHAAVGFHSVGEEVRLLEVEPWRMRGTVQKKFIRKPKREVETVYFACISREVEICQQNGILSYAGDADNVPVGQFISASPLTQACNSFSLEIIDSGDGCCIIAIGVCPKTYPRDRMPGWNLGSFAYHADDGGIFIGKGKALEYKEKCCIGDVMKCRVDFRSRCISFYKNNRLIHTIKNLIDVNNFHASVGFRSVGEEVRLLETEPWKNITFLKDDSPSDGSFSVTEETDCTNSVRGSNNILPIYWSIKKLSKTTNYLVDIDTATKKSIEKVVMNTFDSSLVGLGRDARHMRYSNIQIVEIKRVENPDLFEAYHMQRKLLRKKISETSCHCVDVKNILGSKGDIKTTGLLSDNIKKELMSEINEHYLFHGTKASTVNTIIKSGLDFRLSNAACLFGRGIYASETFTKADQYTDDRDQRSATGSYLHIFLTRMSLGNVFLCDEKHKTVANRGSAKLNRPPCMECHEDMCNCENQVLYDSVMGDGKWLHREFVVYNNHQCYPEYLITYERV